MANAVEDTPQNENNHENEGKIQHPNVPIINLNDALREFIVQYQLQQIEQPLLCSGLTINILLSLTDTEIDDISKELTKSATTRVKFKYGIKQLQKQKVKSNNIQNNNQNNNNDQITHKFMNEYEEKTYIFIMVTTINDPDKARQILKDNDWDLHTAVAKQFGTTPGMNPLNTPKGTLPPYKDLSKTEITLLLSDNRQFKYTMHLTDTFWTVYSNLLQSATDMTSKLFDLQLVNGHVLKEYEFDKTLREYKLTPQGIINVNIRNNNSLTNINRNVTINVIIFHPINKKRTFNLEPNDTIWAVYSLLLQSVPELSTNVFTLALSNGHVLKEYEFDNTLQHLELVPTGNITVKLGNQYNKNKHKGQYNKPKQPFKQNVSQYVPSHLHSQPSHSSSNDHMKQMQTMIDDERRQREKYEREMEERRRKQEREQRDRERKQKEMEKKRKQNFIRAVRSGLQRIAPKYNQCVKCGLGFSGNSEGSKQRSEHQKRCAKTWNCGICGKYFDKYRQHQSHVRSCSDVKMMY